MSYWKMNSEYIALLNEHVESCEQCKKACRLRFTSVSTAQINAKRCIEGRRLAEIAFVQVAFED